MPTKIAFKVDRYGELLALMVGVAIGVMLGSVITVIGLWMADRL